MSGFPKALTATEVAAAGGLLAANNLSDVAAAATARGNLAAMPLDYTFNIQATDYQLALADSGKVVGITKSTSQVLTVPANSVVAFPIGTNILIAQLGAGTVVVTPDSGVTINADPGTSLAAQYKYAALVKRGTDEWDLTGGIA